ncbi:hypothetical protein AB8P72_08825 [Psychrobacter sp. CLB018]|uniref:hypothetical protein n=1 Tax=Psychrobacter sp. CLB018 TaxID=3240930 RepID=UPI003512B779
MSELLTMQDLANGHLDVKALGEAANGDENMIVTTRTGNTYPSAERAINIMFQNGGLPATPFATKALMTASALANDKYAQVTDDTVNNGLYLKTAGAWVKSAYDPVAQSKSYTDEVTEGVLIDSKPDTIKGDTIQAYITSTGVLSAETEGSTVVIYKVKASTQYTVEKEISSRFVIYGYTTKPVASSTPVQAVKTLDAPTVQHVDSNGRIVEAHTFTTEPNVEYIAVYTKRVTDVKTPAIQMKEGGLFDFTANYFELSKDVIFGGKTLSDIPTTATGKNIFNGEYVNSFLVGNTTSPNVIMTGSADAKSAVVRVKPNTTYTVSKTASNRFKVAVTEVYPSNFWENAGRVLMDDNRRSDTEFTFTTNENEIFVIVFVAFEGALPPVFMQIEEGPVKTQWMTYGKVLVDTPKYVDDAGNVINAPDGGNTPTPATGYLSYLDIGVGDAKYTVRGNPEVYTDSSMTTVATDDTDALQAAFDRGGVIYLNGNKSYKVSRPLDIDLTKVKYIDGNGATLVSTHDGVTLRAIGEQVGTAAPFNTTAMMMFSVNRHIKGLRLTSASGFTGQAATISNTFMLEFDVEVYWMRDGIEYINQNRNIRLRAKIYMLQEDGIRFDKTCNLHQGQVYVGDVSYCKRAVYFDDPEIYNLQFIGGDYEMGTASNSSYSPLIPDCLIHMRVENGILADITFSGITFEDHTLANVLFKIESPLSSACRNIRFTNNFYGNALKNMFEVGNVFGLVITGRAEAIADNFLKVTGRLKAAHVDVSVSSAKTLLHSVGDFALEQSHFKFVASGITGNPVILDCDIKMMHLTDCIMESAAALDFDATKGFIDVVATGNNVRQLRISNNTMFTVSGDIDIVKVSGSPSARVRVQGNESNLGGRYPASGGNIVANDNY